MKTRFTCCAVCLLILLAGCGAPKATETKSGFLTDYSKLEKVDGNSAFYKTAGFDLKNYAQIKFEPVKVQLSQELLESTKLEAAQQQQIAEYAANELNRKLSAGFTGQGTGTLNVRTAVSGISNTSEELSAWQYVPVALAVTAAKEAAGKRDRALVLFFEAEATEETTGKIVAAKLSASELGLVDNADFQNDPVATIKPMIDKAINKLVAGIKEQLQ